MYMSIEPLVTKLKQVSSPILCHVIELIGPVMDKNVFPSSHKSTSLAIFNSLQSFKLVFGKVQVNLPLVTRLKQVSSSILSQIIEHLILVIEKMLSLVVIKVPVLLFFNSFRKF